MGGPGSGRHKEGSSSFRQAAAKTLRTLRITGHKPGASWVVGVLKSKSSRLGKTKTFVKHAILNQEHGFLGRVTAGLKKGGRS